MLWALLKSHTFAFEHLIFVNVWQAPGIVVLGALRFYDVSLRKLAESDHFIGLIPVQISQV